MIDTIRSHVRSLARTLSGRLRLDRSLVLGLLLVFLVGVGAASVTIHTLSLNPVTGASNAAGDPIIVESQSLSITNGNTDSTTLVLRHPSEHRVACAITGTLRNQQGGIVDQTATKAVYLPAGATVTTTLDFPSNPSTGNYTIFETATAECEMLGWPMFGFNPARTGTSTRLISAIAGPASVTENWTNEVSAADPVRTAPTLANGRVFVGSGDDSVYALHDENGTVDWQYVTTGDVNGSPAVADGSLYVGSRGGSLTALDPTSGTEQWRNTSVGAIRSSPAVTGGTVYVGSDDGNVYALDASDGSGRWRYGTGGDIRSSPAVVDGTLYVGSTDGSLYALNLTDGTEEWTNATGGPVYSSPAVVNDTVYVGSDDGFLYARNATDGSEKWVYDADGAIRTAPAVVNGTVYVGTDAGTLTAIDAGTGTAEWTHSIGGQVRSDPAVANETVYLGSDGGTVYAFNATTGVLKHSDDVGGAVTAGPAVQNNFVYVSSHDGAVTRLEAGIDGWTMFGYDATNVGYALLDAPTGSVTEAWNVSTGGNVTASPAVVNDTVFVGNRNGTVYALTEGTGATRWTQTGVGPVDSSAAVVGDTVYVGSKDDSLYALRESDGTVDWSFTTGGDVDASPSVTDGTVYVGSDDDSLYALDATTGSEQWTFATGGDIPAAPAVDAGTVYAGSRDSNLYALGAGSGTEQWRFRAGAPVTQAPAIDDDTLYVTDDANEEPIQREAPHRTLPEWRQGVFNATTADGANASLSGQLSMSYDNGTSGDGLVGYWRMDRTVTGSSGTVTDYSGEGNDGTTGNSVTKGAGGVLGTNGYSYDNTDANVSVPHSSKLGVSGDVTVSTWIKTSSLGTSSQNSNQTALVTKSDFGSKVGYELIDNGDYTSNVIWRIYGSGDYWEAPVSRSKVNDGSWHHLVGVRDGGTIRLYLDGVEQSSTSSTSFDPASNDLGIGADPGGTRSLQNGTLDEVQIYDRALSATDVRELYRYGGDGTHTGNFSRSIDTGRTYEWQHLNVTGVEKPSSTTLTATVYALDGSGSTVDSQTVTVDPATTQYDLTMSPSEDARIEINGSTTDIGQGWRIDDATLEYERAAVSETTTTTTERIDSTADWNNGTYDQTTADGANASLSSQLSMTYGNGTSSGDRVGYWRMDRAVSGTGGTVLDYSGEGNDATTDNNVITGAGGVLGTEGYSYNNTDANVSVPHSSNLGVSGDLTVSTWIKTSSLNSDNQTAILTKSDFGTSVGYELIDNGNYTNEVVWRVYGDGTYSDATFSRSEVNDDAWHHLVGVRDGGTIELYLDGTKQDSTSSVPFDPSTQDLGIGADAGGTRSLENGNMDEVQIYNRSLSASEVSALYRTGGDGTYDGNYSQTVDSSTVGSWDTLSVSVPALPSATAADVTVEAVDSSGTVVDSETHALASGTNSFSLALSDTDRTRITINGTSTDVTQSFRIDDVTLKNTTTTTTSTSGVCRACWPVPIDSVGEWDAGSFNGSTADGASSVDRDDLRIGYANGTTGDSLNGYWRMDGPVAGTDGTVVDYSEYSNVGNTTNITTGADGVFGSPAFGYDKTAGHVEVAHTSDLAVSGNVTVSLWLKTTSLGSSSHSKNQTALFSKGDFNNKVGYTLLDNGDDASEVVWRIYGGGSFWDTGINRSKVNDGTWHNVVATRKGGTIEIYLDGVQQNSTSGTTFDPSSITLGIGADRGGGRSLQGGSIDEPRLYDRALSVAEIRELYRWGEDGQFGGNYSQRIDTPNTQRWTELSANVTALPTETSLEATVEAVDDGGSVVDSQTIALSGGSQTHSLSVANSKNARVLINGTTTNVSCSWKVDNVTLHREEAPPTQRTTLDTLPQWDRGRYVGTSPDAATASGTLSMRYANGTATDSLVGYWRTDEATSGSGGTVVDYSGHGNDGTTSGSLTAGATGVFNSSSFDYDGSDDHVDVGQPQELDLTGDMTVAGWVNVESGTLGLSDSKNRTVIGKGTSQYEIQLDKDDTWRFKLSDGTSQTSAVASTATTAGTWIHLVARHDDASDSMSLWINGTRVDSASITSVNANSDPVWIGNNSAATNRNFNGKIDELRVYDEVLSSDEISTLYRTGGDGTYDGNYTHTVDTGRTQNWSKMAVNVTGLPPETSAEATVEARDDAGTILDSRTVTLSSGETVHSLSLSNSQNARVTINGTSTNVTDTFAVENVSLTYDTANAPSAADSEIVALNATQGTIDWGLDLETDVTTSPAVDGDTVYVGLHNGTILAVDAETGAKRWTYDADGTPIHASPAVVNDTVYFGGNSSVVYAVNATDGTQRWTLPTNDPVRSAPAPINGTVYVGGDDTGVRAAR